MDTHITDALRAYAWQWLAHLRTQQGIDRDNIVGDDYADVLRDRPIEAWGRLIAAQVGIAERRPNVPSRMLDLERMLELEQQLLAVMQERIDHALPIPNTPLDKAQYRPQPGQFVFAGLAEACHAVRGVVVRSALTVPVAELERFEQLARIAQATVEELGDVTPTELALCINLLMHDYLTAPLSPDPDDGWLEVAGRLTHMISPDGVFADAAATAASRAANGELDLDALWIETGLGIAELQVIILGHGLPDDAIRDCVVSHVASCLQLADALRQSLAPIA